MPYVGNTDADRRVMLDALGLSDISDLFTDIPEEHRFPALDLPDPLSELEAVTRASELAAENGAGAGMISFAGAGAYHHFVPSVVSYLAGRGEFATAYTPYQAEASQGTLQTIFEYQSMVAALLDMDVVNASHYDGATALAEAAIMAVRAVRGRTRVAVAGSVHPEYVEVARSYLRPQAIALDVIGAAPSPGSTGPSPEELAAAVDERTACLVVQSPDFFGRVADLHALADAVHQKGALFVVHTDPIAATLFRSPGSLGADIVTGEGQPLGIPVSFGGPYLGIFAARAELVRKMPGRLVGQTTDTEGRRGFVLTLNTREQHIRREKATSNICTNQGLMALRAAIYLACMGPAGLREVAELCYHKAHYAAGELAAIPGCRVAGSAPGTASGSTPAPFFKEFVLDTPVPAVHLIRRAAGSGVIPGVALSRYYPERTHELLVAVTEMSTRGRINRLVSTVRAIVEGKEAADE